METPLGFIAVTDVGTPAGQVLIAVDAIETVTEVRGSSYASASIRTKSGQTISSEQTASQIWTRIGDAMKKDA